MEEKTIETKVSWADAFITEKKKEAKPFNKENVDKVEFYNRHADIYNEEMVAFGDNGAFETARNLHAHLNGKLSAKILDVGGGTGAVIAELKQLAAYNNADGLDPAAKMLAIGKKRGLYNKTFTQYFTVDSGIPRGTYDAVCSSAAFVPGHIKSETVGEMHHILKPGGHIVIVMRKSYMAEDEDLRKLRPLIQTMSNEGMIDVVQDYTLDNYFAGYDGQVFVLRKIC